MEKFTNIIGYIKLTVFSVVFLLLLLIEAYLPLRKRKYSLSQRLTVNFCLSAIVFAISVFIIRPTALHIVNRTTQQSFGLLNIIPLSNTVHFLLGFLLMDLTFYYWHRANHFFTFFRRFHSVHHIDPDMDVTTSFRFHFGEILYSIVFRVLQVALIGVSPIAYTLYEFTFQYATMFHHSNTRLPIHFERRLNKVFVTPRMHGIHHSTVKIETNSNYSVIFRWWDMLFGTLRLNVPQSDIDIGVAGYQNSEDNRFLKLLSMPFRKQRKREKTPFTKDRLGTNNPSLMLE
jgi:sterol desaturase/sphingolipid hydroxylase (fatty acid hydroxylase superfamily)